MHEELSGPEGRKGKQEGSDSIQKLLRAETGQLRLLFNNVVASTLPEATTLDRSVPPLLEPNSIAVRAQSAMLGICNEEIPAKKRESRFVTLLNPEAVLHGKRCLILGSPAIEEPVNNPIRILPLRFACWDERLQFFVKFQGKAETFPLTAGAAIIFDYLDSSGECSAYPFFTPAGFKVAAEHAGKIGERIALHRKEDARRWLSEVEPSTIISIILNKLLEAEALPESGSKDLKEWPYLGLTQLKMVETNGVWQIGFLRVSIRSNAMTEEIFTVQVARNKLGLIETSYIDWERKNINSN